MFWAGRKARRLERERWQAQVVADFRKYLDEQGIREQDLGSHHSAIVEVNNSQSLDYRTHAKFNGREDQLDSHCYLDSCADYLNDDDDVSWARESSTYILNYRDSNSDYVNGNGDDIVIDSVDQSLEGGDKDGFHKKKELHSKVGIHQKSQLDNKVELQKDFEQFRKEKSQVKSFNDYFRQVIDERLKIMPQFFRDERDVYNASGVSRHAFGGIKNNKHRIPQRRTLCAFIIGLRLNLNEAETLLNRAGYNFGKTENDLDGWVTFFCIENQLYDIKIADEILSWYGQSPLGTRNMKDEKYDC